MTDYIIHSNLRVQIPDMANFLTIFEQFLSKLTNLNK